MAYDVTAPRSRWRRSIAALGGIAALAVPAVAHAQATTFYLDRLFMAGAPDDGIGIFRPQMGAKTRFFGQLGLGFSYEPFRLENEIASGPLRAQIARVAGNPVNYQLTTYADVGVELMDRVSIQVSLPFVAPQAGNTTGFAGLGTTTTAAAPNTAALMDMRLDVRGIVYRNESRSFKVALEGGVWIPTGNSVSYGSDRGASGSLGFGAEWDLKSVFFVGNMMWQGRPQTQINDFQVGSEIRYAVGGFVPLRDGKLRLGAEIFGSFPTDQTGLTGPNANLPLEWMAEGRYWFDPTKQWYVGAGGGTRLTAGYSPDFRIVALAGYSFGVEDTHPPSPGKRWKAERVDEQMSDRDHDKIPDEFDLCPDDPEDGKPPNPDDGCPAPADRDGDGIPDSIDKCPDQPEDFDGIQDEDGCPEDDADHDGIPDAQDACPLEPGDPDPDPKKNGCPKFIRRVKGSSEIQILKVIEFATGKADILPRSFPILDEVVRLLKVNPEITHLEVEGHTDNRGSDQLNEKLSNDRAHSVMKYLVQHGIVDNRLSAQGFGPRRPIADNNTDDGRQKNRRVEFHIKNQETGSTSTSIEKKAEPTPNK